MIRGPRFLLLVPLPGPKSLWVCEGVGWGMAREERTTRGGTHGTRKGSRSIRGVRGGRGCMRRRNLPFMPRHARCHIHRGPPFRRGVFAFSCTLLPIQVRFPRLSPLPCHLLSMVVALCLWPRKVVVLRTKSTSRGPPPKHTLSSIRSILSPQPMYKPQPCIPMRAPSSTSHPSSFNPCTDHSLVNHARPVLVGGRGRLLPGPGLGLFARPAACVLPDPVLHDGRLLLLLLLLL